MMLKDRILESSSHYCSCVNKLNHVELLKYFDNLARKNMLNIKPKFKKNPCNDLYSDEYDSYISLVSLRYLKRL